MARRKDSDGDEPPHALVCGKVKSINNRFLSEDGRRYGNLRVFEFFFSLVGIQQCLLGR